MSFSESARICLQKYIDFNGRASRSEYWWFVLLTFALGFIPVIGWLIRLALLLPSLAVQVRRLHDLGRSAWWLLLLVPPIFIIGGPVLLIMSAFPGTPGPNRYGPDPLAQPYGTVRIRQFSFKSTLRASTPCGCLRGIVPRCAITGARCGARTVLHSMRHAAPGGS